jgi:type I restriction enzyme M protein
MIENLTVEELLHKAEDEDFIRFTGEGKNHRIIYVHSNEHSERWSDPEEKVRAAFYCELIYNYKYPAKHIEIEHNVADRVPNYFCDIVIHESEDWKTALVAIECKKDGISANEFEQAVKQACNYRLSIGAKFAGVIAGGTRRFLEFINFPPLERERNRIADLPPFKGEIPQWRFWKEVPGRDLRLAPREDLRSAIRKCHQTLWEGGRRSPITAFGEFSKIMFIKIRDEKNTEDGQPYTFQIKTKEPKEDLAKRIHTLYEAERKDEPEVFKDPINVDPNVLAQVVEHIERINFNKTDLDTKGVAFEEFMGGFFKGDFGQYFTPREIINFCVNMLQINNKDYILDPACGSGGFLLYALDYIREQANRKYPKPTENDTRAIERYTYWHGFAENNLFGFEINEELARVAKMNMIVHDDGHSNIIGTDALDFIGSIRDKAKNREKVTENSFDVVLSNPPFGSVVKESEKGNDYLEQFSLRKYLNKSTTGVDIDLSADSEQSAKSGAKSVKARASVKTEILFIERIYDFLKPNGRAAVILPDGILTNASLQGVRDWLMERFQILAVVSLPQIAFAHYDAGVKASILFLRKRADGEKSGNNEAIFMAQAENIGYDATGRKTFKTEYSKEVWETSKIEHQSCDFFDYEVEYEWSEIDPKRPTWSEKHRKVIPDTGIVFEFHKFEVNPNLYEAPNNNFIVINRDEILNKRIDAKFYLLGGHHLDNEDFVTLGSLVIQEPDYGTSSRATPKVNSTDINYIRITDFGEDGIPNDHEYVTAETYDERHILNAKDIIFARSGATVGKTYFHDENANKAIFAGYCIRFRFDTNKVLPEYAYLCTKTRRYKSWVNSIQRPSGQPNINKEEFKSFTIPLPDLKKQQLLVDEMKIALEERKKIIAEAESLWQAAKDRFEAQLLAGE